jgi:hypothetical protein
VVVVGILSAMAAFLLFRARLLLRVGVALILGGFDQGVQLSLCTKVSTRCSAQCEGQGQPIHHAACYAAFAVVTAHACVRAPNLKARLSSAREEFRAVWRGQQMASSVRDYAL